MTSLDTAQQQVIYKALEYINYLGLAELTYGHLEDRDEVIFYLYVIDEKMRNHAHKMVNYNDPNKETATAISTVKISLGKSYFWSKVADPYDSAIGITRDMSLEQKAILRCAYRILDEYNTWYKNMTSKYPDLKYK